LFIPNPNIRAACCARSILSRLPLAKEIDLCQIDDFVAAPT
jgi:hypothetical protein